MLALENLFSHHPFNNFLSSCQFNLQCVEIGGKLFITSSKCLSWFLFNFFPHLFLMDHKMAIFYRMPIKKGANEYFTNRLLRGLKMPAIFHMIGQPILDQRLSWLGNRPYRFPVLKKKKKSPGWEKKTQERTLFDIYWLCSLRLKKRAWFGSGVTVFGLGNLRRTLLNWTNGLGSSTNFFFIKWPTRYFLLVYQKGRKPKAPTQCCSEATSLLCRWTLLLATMELPPMLAVLYEFCVIAF